jgi:hypothetical protein
VLASTSSLDQQNHQQDYDDSARGRRPVEVAPACHEVFRQIRDERRHIRDISSATIAAFSTG